MKRLPAYIQNTSTIMIIYSIVFAIVIAMSVIFCEPSFPANNSEEEPEYIIGIGDTIQLYVWQHDQFNSIMTVGPDGKISIPLLGTIKIAGLTREETKKDINERLSKFIKEDAEVVVSIAQYNSRKIYVFGQVRNSRVITFSSTPTLMEVMVQTIPAPDADLTAIKIIPADSSVREPIIVNMEEVLQKGDTSLLPKLHQGDTVYIPMIKPEDGETPTQPTAVETQEEKFTVHIMGAVARPGSYISDEEPMITQVLSYAGSVTDNIALKDIRVIRAGPTEGDRVVHVDMDKYLKEGDASLLPRLYSGDIVYVPNVTQERIKEVSILITGEVLKPGSYETLEALDILDAIALAGGLSRDADPERIRIRRETDDSYQEKIVNIDEFLKDIASASPPEMVEPGYRIYVPAKRGSATKVAVAARGMVAFLADLIPIYSLYRLIKG